MQRKCEKVFNTSHRIIQTVGHKNTFCIALYNEHAVLYLDIKLDLIISKKNYDSL